MLIGSPTLELYVNSWNAKYSSDKIYITTRTSMTDSIGWGYYVGDAENSTTYDVSKSNSDPLYYLYTSSYESCNGYWLVSPSAYNGNRVMRVNYNGSVGSNNYNNTELSFRPVVCLPSNIF